MTWYNNMMIAALSLSFSCGYFMGEYFHSLECKNVIPYVYFKIITYTFSSLKIACDIVSWRIKILLFPWKKTKKHNMFINETLKASRRCKKAWTSCADFESLPVCTGTFDPSLVSEINVYPLLSGLIVLGVLRSQRLWS